MTKMNHCRCFGFRMAKVVLMGLIFVPVTVPAQEEVASAIQRYKGYEVSTGYYEEYEVLPRHRRPMANVSGVRRNILSYSPSAASARVRTRLWDAHQGLRFYEHRQCEDCHARETKSLHTVRANLTCRQCHGGEPIAGIRHYYSPMNPIRRHAYVCAKCHQGASASFATYVVHAPNPAMISTKKSFPVLFYVFWTMACLAAGTFALFLPLTVIWGIRERFQKGGERK